MTEPEKVTFLSTIRDRIFTLRDHPVLRNTLWLYVVTIGSYAVPLITLPYLSHILSVEKFGLLAYAQSLIWNFVTLTEYGFNLTATRATAQHRDDPVYLSRIFSAVLAAKGLLTLAGGLIYCAYVLYTPSTRANWPLFIASFISVFGYWLFPSWLFQGLEMMKQVAFRDFMAKLLGLVVMFLLVKGDDDVIWAAVAPALGLLLAGVLGFFQLQRLTPVRLVRPNWAEIRAQFIEAWPPFLNSGASAITYSLNILILGNKGMTVEIGLFNAAHRIVSVPKSLINPLTTAIYAHLSHATAGSEAKAIQFVRRNGKLLTLPFLALSLVMVVAEPFVIPMFLGQKYTLAILPCQILSMGVYVFALTHVYSTYFMLPCGFEKEWTRRSLCVLPFGLAVNWIAMYFLPGSVSLAIHFVAMDALALFLFWRFYRQRAALLDSQNGLLLR